MLRVTLRAFPPTLLVTQLFGCFHPTGTPDTDTDASTSASTGDQPKDCEAAQVSYDKCKKQGGNELFCQDKLDGCQEGPTTGNPDTSDPTTTDATTGVPNNTDTDASSGDPGSTGVTTGDPTCVPLTCENLPRPEGCGNQDDPLLLGELYETVLGELDPAFFSCCVDVSSLEAKFACLDLPFDPNDLTKPATTCDQENLLAALPETPRQIITMNGKVQDIGVGKDVTLTPAVGCGFTVNYPLTSLVVYAQELLNGEQKCSPGQPAQPNLPISPLRIVVDDPNGLTMFDVPITEGKVDVFLGVPGVYSADGKIEPLNLRGAVNESSPGQYCVGYESAGGNVTIKGIAAALNVN